MTNYNRHSKIQSDKGIQYMGLLVFDDQQNSDRGIIIIMVQVYTLPQMHQKQYWFLFCFEYDAGIMSNDINSMPGSPPENPQISSMLYNTRRDCSPGTFVHLTIGLP